MMTLEPGNWFTEICREGGSAISLAIRAHTHSEKTPYQTIDIYETVEYGNLMVIDGCVMLTTRDNFLYHEMMSHPALFTHPKPERVVIIGGGDCGTLREVLKHDTVQHVLQVEIDERVTRLAEEYFPELCVANSDPRAEFLFGDGIGWMAEAQGASVDVIVIDNTDPIGPAEGLFNEPFYAQCRRVLRDDGLLVAQSESPLIHGQVLARMCSNLKQAGFAQCRTLCFPQPTYPTGWWSATMAGRALPLDRFREQDAAARAFETVYYNPEIHRAALARPPFLQAHR